MVHESLYPLTTWRLIQTPARNGAWNMAVDEVILETIGRGEALPTLRLYAWQPPCLSLGYAQPSSDVDLPRLQAYGWHLVRRPTGGRAILHTDELTYSVIGPSNDPRLSGSVLECYRKLSAALLEALSMLGVQAESRAGSSSDPNSVGPVCFEVPSNYEITVESKKLIGSAQARRKEGILQHGTLPLEGDLGRITYVLPFPDEAARQSAAERLHAHAATLLEILDHTVSWENAAQALASAFQKTLNLDLVSSYLSDSELERADHLVKEKYAHPDWLYK